MNARILCCAALACAVLTSAEAVAADDSSPPLRAGLIGLDTSHVIAFTKILNDPEETGELAGVRVVAGYPGGTDIPASRDRVEKFTQQLREMGVEIVDSIPELLQRVDVVLLESVDGRPHREQALPVIKAGKPLFIDKPVAGSLVDAVAIYQAAKQHNVPVFSSSMTRFQTGVQAIRSGDIGEVLGCDAYGPCSLEPNHPDLFWYGVHGVEALFTCMGTGCETVTRVTSDNFDLVVGKWSDGRIGCYRGLRKGKTAMGGTAFGSREIRSFLATEGYRPLLVEIAKFFRTGQPPVSAAETVEMFAFMEAADESKRRGGEPVSVASVLVQARKALASAEK
jgi:hypothetical protein